MLALSLPLEKRTAAVAIIVIVIIVMMVGMIVGMIVDTPGEKYRHDRCMYSGRNYLAGICWIWLSNMEEITSARNFHGDRATSLPIIIVVVVGVGIV